MIQIGGAIKNFRTARKMTLKDLAAKAKISPSYLSQIENDQVNMNMSVLEGISQGLGVPVYMFFMQESIDNISYVPAGGRVCSVRGDGVLMQALVNHRGLRKAAHIMEIPSGYSAQQYSSHQGEEFYFVLEGGMEMDFSGLKRLVLEQGDSLAFCSRIPHRISSAGGCAVLTETGTLPEPV